jgi:hypothetical protein
MKSSETLQDSVGLSCVEMKQRLQGKMWLPASGQQKQLECLIVEEGCRERNMHAHHFVAN